MTNEQDSRFARALAGEVVEPPVVGLTFVPDTALSDRGGPGSAVAALARVCADADLDFVFIASWGTYAERAAAACSNLCAAPVWVVPGVLTPALDRIGVVAGLRATIGEPEVLRPALDEAVAVAVANVERGIGLGVRAVAVADDICGTSGPFVTPEYVREELLPRYAAVASAAAAAGAPCILHCDGGAAMPPDEMRDGGFAALHPGGMSDEGFERLLADAHRAGVRIIGGIMTRDLSAGTPKAVLAGARMGMLARGGGLLLADDGGITSYEEYAALLAAFAAARGPE